MGFILDDNTFVDNNIFDISLVRGDIQYILDFVLLWNLYELKIIKAGISPGELTLNLDEVNDCFAYFQDRYTGGDIQNERFNKLKLSNNIKNTIKDNLVNGNNKVETILCIVKRFRNNLFHGHKKIKFIGNQERNFSHANTFLRHILSNINN